METRIQRSESLTSRLEAAKGAPLIMGVLNLTPDSFSDGGAFLNLADAIIQAKAMIHDGAFIIDVGGESTRPGATPVAEADELARVLPVVSALTREANAVLSIDTYKAPVARAAALAGAVMINDISGLTRDSAMARTAAETESLLVITYNRGEANDAINLVDDMRAFCDHALAAAHDAGIPDRHVLLDPGIGFAKTFEQNFLLLARLDALLDYGRPVLVGASRKRFIGRLTDAAVGERLGGTIAAHLAATRAGASVIRVHDVAAHRQAFAVTEAIGAAR